MAWIRCTGNTGGSLKVLTASGDIASFETNLALPYKSVKVNVLATGGNGTPDNPNPINGYTKAKITRCGVNLFDGSKVTTTHPSNWSVTFENGNLTIVHKTAYVSGAPTFNLDLPLGTYVISYTATQLYKVSLYVNGVYNKLLNSGTTFTIENGNIYTVTFTAEDNSTNVISNIQIELGNTATEYHPYTGNAYTIAFGQTVYGCVIDVTRGKLHVTHQIVDLGTLSWYNGSTDTNDIYRKVALLPDTIILPTATTIANLLCTNYQAVSPLDTYRKVEGVSLNNNVAQVTIYDSNYNASDDLSEFIEYISGAKLVYPLETPFDIDLTPQQIEALLGVNNVWHDGNGNTEVKYLYNA